MEEFAKKLGFDSEKDLLNSISSVDLSTNEKLKAFEYWKQTDGTKTGLLKLNKKT